MKEKEEGATPRRPGLLVRLTALAVTAALLLGALALVVYRDRFNLDALRRWFEYRELETSETGEAEPFTHAGGEQASFAYLKNGVLMASAAGARYYSLSGELYAEEVRNLEHPVLSASKEAGVVYDAGGELLSARLNDAGWLAVTYQGGGHKGTDTVYDGTYTKEIIKINLSTFIVDAAVSPDCRTVAIVTMGQENGSFQSQIRFYPVDQKEPSATVPLGNMVVMDLDYEDGQLWVLGEDRVTTVSEDGSVTGSYSLGRNYLKGCSFGGDGFAVLLLSRYRAGSAGQAVVVGPDGTETASLTLPVNVLDLDAAGRYLALLSGERLEVYTSDLTPYSSLEHTQNARHLSLSDSGAALLANAQRAWLYLPS